MKSIEELKAIKAKTLEKVQLRKEGNGTRVVVGMATCGIAAGARPVMSKFVEEVAKRKLSDVVVSQTGCIGACRLEPMVEVYKPDQEKVTYVKVNPDMVDKIITEHIINDRVVTENTIGYHESHNQ